MDTASFGKSHQKVICAVTNSRWESGLLNEPKNKIHKLSGSTFNPLT